VTCKAWDRIVELRRQMQQLAAIAGTEGDGRAAAAEASREDSHKQH